MTITAGTVVELLPVDAITPDPDNVRASLGNLAELTTSIKANGVLQPLLVDLDHVIVAGHRRHAAAKAAGLDTVPCIVGAFTGTDRLVAQLVENLQRADIPPLDEARGYARLMELGMTQAKLAKAVGRSKSHVAGRIDLLGLADEVEPLLEKGEVSLAEAAVLAKLDHGTQKAVVVSAGEHRRPITDDYVEQLAARAKLEAERDALIVAGEVAAQAGTDWKRLTYYSDRSSLEANSEEQKAHEAEPCHRRTAMIGYSGLNFTDWCAEPDRHKAKGASSLKLGNAGRASGTDAEKVRRQTKKASNLELLAFANRLTAKPDAAALKLATEWALDMLVAGWSTTVYEGARCTWLALGQVPITREQKEAMGGGLGTTYDHATARALADYATASPANRKRVIVARWLALVCSNALTYDGQITQSTVEMLAPLGFAPPVELIAAPRKEPVVDIDVDDDDDETLEYYDDPDEFLGGNEVEDEGDYEEVSGSELAGDELADRYA